MAFRTPLRFLSSRNLVTEFHSGPAILARPGSSFKGSVWSCRDLMLFFLARAFSLALTTHSTDLFLTFKTLFLTPHFFTTQGIQNTNNNNTNTCKVQSVFNQTESKANQISKNIELIINQQNSWLILTEMSHKFKKIKIWPFTGADWCIFWYELHILESSTLLTVLFCDGTSRYGVLENLTTG